MVQVSRTVIIYLNGVPTELDVDANIFGTGTVAQRPASGSGDGDLYFVADDPLFAIDRWDGAKWIRTTIVGPQGGSVNNRIMRWSGVGGDQALNSLATLGDTGDIDNAQGQYNGTRHYNDSATDPVAPTPADGDRYWNTALDMEMRFDGGRSKWLSVESMTILGGRRNQIGVNAFYELIGKFAMSAVAGFPALHNGTIVAFGYTRTDTDSADFEVTEGGVTRSTIVSTAISGQDTTLNDDVTAGGVLGVRNGAGGNTTSNVYFWLRVRWRV